MKKYIFIGITILSLFIFSISCKKKFGEFNLQQLSGNIVYNAVNNTSSLQLQVKGTTLNYIKGSFKKWYFVIYNSDNEELLKISDENYMNISSDIEVQKTDVDLYYDGFLIVKTTKNIPGDILNGGTPDRLLLRCTIEDQYGNKTEHVLMGLVQYFKIEF